MEEFDDVEYGLPDITIPAELLACKTISWTERALFGYIRNFCYSPKGCFASNKHLSVLLGCTVSTVSHGISHLTDAGFIDCEYRYINKNLTKRFISISVGIYDKKNKKRSNYKTRAQQREESQMQKVTMGQMQKVASLISIVEPISTVEEKETKKHVSGENPTDAPVNSLKSKPFEKRKPHILFNKVNTNPFTEEEAIAATFFREFGKYRNELHPFVADDQMSKGLSLIKEHMGCMEVEEIDNVINQHFNKKIFKQQGRDFKWNLFVSNLHMYVSERFK